LNESTVYILYLLFALGGAAVYFLMPRTQRNWTVVGSLFGARKPKEDTEPVKTMTVRQEKKKLRRVMKTGKMARKHGSEAFQATSMTQKDVHITEQVMEGIAPSVPTAPQRTQETFTCVQCGADVPLEADRCPTCQSLYIKDVSDEALDEGAAEENALDEDVDAFMATEATPWKVPVHMAFPGGLRH